MQRKRTPPKRTAKRASPPSLALERIADAVLALKRLRTSLAERAEAGGRLIEQALRRGAFLDAPLRVHVEQRLAMPQGPGLADPFISAWAELGDRLRHGDGPFPDRDLEADFADDCERVATAIRREAKAGAANKPQGELTKHAKAISALWEHPEATDAEIAERAGCNVKSLYRMKNFREARAIIRESGRKLLPRGRKPPGEPLEAWDDETAERG